MAFSDRLRERRESLGLSRSVLAHRLGVTAAAIGNYENGISSPKEEILYKIFKELDVEPNYLWQDEMAMNSQTFIASYPEQEHIKKYRALDEHGKKLVDNILDMEYERMNQPRRITSADLEAIEEEQEYFGQAAALGGETFVQEVTPEEHARRMKLLKEYDET